jgi:16S rRNA (adenine1518-N6/adenine1519-N6)-dimethyltransferase
MLKEKIQKKKSLGQHFLHNAHYLEAVVKAAAIKKGSVVVEIGPGEGTLTAVLLAHGARVVAVEKDRRLIPILKEKFAQEIKNKKLAVVEADALKFDTAGHIKGDYTVVGNIPYYITGALIRKYLTNKHQPETLVFLIQKEVAERITHHGAASKKAKESILSLSVQAYGMPKYVTTVPRGAFAPAPKVDSAILAVTGISRKHFSKKRQEERFFELVRAGFAQKRKLLKRNLESILGKGAGEALTKAGIAENARAEDVPLLKWLALSGI